MAIYLASKAPADAIRYEWDLGAGKSLVSFELTASGAVIDAESGSGNLVEFFVSGGTAGQTATIEASAILDDGTEYSDTLYLPIVASAAQIANTARDYVSFAMRKVVGIGETAEAEELVHGLEVLNGLLARWREGGADIGAPFPVDANSVIYCPDWAASALRYNLLIECAPLYAYEPTAMEYEQARRGLQLVKHKNLPDVRDSEYF